MVRRGVVMRKLGSVMFADWRAACARCVFESVDCLVELVAGAACCRVFSLTGIDSRF